MGEITSAKRGNIIIENREKLTAGGVKDVESFSPEKIILETELKVFYLQHQFQI